MLKFTLFVDEKNRYRQITAFVLIFWLFPLFKEDYSGLNSNPSAAKSCSAACL